MKFAMTGLAVALSCAAACSSTSEREIKLQRALDEAKVSLRDSVAVAETETQAGVAIKAALLVSGEPVFSVGAQTSQAFQDVRVDILSGKVISMQAASAPAESCPNAVSLAEAIAAAEAEVGGKGVSIGPDDDGHCNREVLVMSGGTLYEAKVGPSGKVLETEEADDDEGED